MSRYLTLSHTDYDQLRNILKDEMDDPDRARLWRKIAAAPRGPALTLTRAELDRLEDVALKMQALVVEGAEKIDGVPLLLHALLICSKRRTEPILKEIIDCYNSLAGHTIEMNEKIREELVAHRIERTQVCSLLYRLGIPSTDRVGDENVERLQHYVKYRTEVRRGHECPLEDLVDSLP